MFVYCGMSDSQYTPQMRPAIVSAEELKQAYEAGEIEKSQYEFLQLFPVDYGVFSRCKMEYAMFNGLRAGYEAEKRHNQRVDERLAARLVPAPVVVPLASEPSVSGKPTGWLSRVMSAFFG